MVCFLDIGILVGVTEYLLLLVGRRDKEWNIYLGSRGKIFLALADIASCFLLYPVYPVRSMDFLCPADFLHSMYLSSVHLSSVRLYFEYPSAERSQAATGLALLCVVQGCMITACIMDLKEKMVYRYVWAAGGLAVAGLFFWRVFGEVFLEQNAALLMPYMVELLLLILLQQLLFSKMYGRADCHAFCVCGAVFLALGGSLDDHVMHMAVTFALLLIVQVCAGNVTWKGQLRKPVPMMPYITAGFWLWVDFNAGKWYIY